MSTHTNWRIAHHFYEEININKPSVDHRKCEYHAWWSESAALPCNFTRQVSSHLFQCLQVGWDFAHSVHWKHWKHTNTPFFYVEFKHVHWESRSLGCFMRGHGPHNDGTRLPPSVALWPPNINCRFFGSQNGTFQTTRTHGWLGKPL